MKQLRKYIKKTCKFLQNKYSIKYSQKAVNQRYQRYQNFIISTKIYPFFFTQYAIIWLNYYSRGRHKFLSNFLFPFIFFNCHLFIFSLWQIIKHINRVFLKKNFLPSLKSVCVCVFFLKKKFLPPISLSLLILLIKKGMDG